MGDRIPGIEGMDPPMAGDWVNDGGVPGRAQELFPVTGLEPLQAHGSGRMITAVTNDWTPPQPRSTPEIVVRGATLAAVAAELDRLPEWGEAGGSLRTDRVPVGTSTSVTVAIHANLVFRLPRWTNYANASPAAQAEWNQMMGFLRAHEQRHLDIAIEEANNLARDLVGQEIGQIPALVTEANRRMHDRQVELDYDTDHGAKRNVPYGNVLLDTTIL